MEENKEINMTSQEGATEKTADQSDTKKNTLDKKKKIIIFSAIGALLAIGLTVALILGVFTKEHVHTPKRAVIENVIPATDKQAGSYDEVVYCSQCGKELSRTGKTIDALLPSVTVDAILLGKRDIDLYMGESYTIDAAVLPDDAENKSLTWESSNDEIVSVSADGVITAKSIGSSLITATASNGVSAECVVVVKCRPDEHVPGLPVVMNELLADCMSFGSFELVVSCTLCDLDLSHETVYGDVFGDHVYSDGICEVCGKSEENEN